MALKWAHQYKQDKVKASPTGNLKWAHQYNPEDRTARAAAIVEQKKKDEPSLWEKTKTTAKAGLKKTGKLAETGLKKFVGFSKSLVEPFEDAFSLGGTKLARKAGGRVGDFILEKAFGKSKDEVKKINLDLAQKDKGVRESISPTTRKIAGTVGSVAGTIGGLGAATKVSGKLVPKLLPKLGKTAKNIATQAGTGAIFEGVNALGEGDKPLEITKKAGKGALLFGAAGPLGEKVGAGAKKLIPGALGHYTGNILKGGVTGAGFSVGDNLLNGEKVDKGTAAKNAVAFAALDLLTGGKYKPDFSKSYEMLGEVNKAYARGKETGVQLDTPFQIGKVSLDSNEKQVMDMLKKTGQSLDDLEKTAKKQYNKAKSPEEKAMLEESLNAVRRLKEKHARTEPQIDRGGAAATGSEPLQTKGQGDTIPAREKIAVNQGITAEAIPPLSPKLSKQGRPSLSVLPKQSKDKLAPPLDPTTAKERRFVSNSALNAEVIPEGMKQELRSNIPRYAPITNKETLEIATNRVTSDINKARSDWRIISEKGLTSADDTALGEALIVDAIKRGDIQAAKEVTVELAENLTSAGQAVQAAAILKRMSPEGMLLYAEKVVGKAKREAHMAGKVAQGEKMAAEVEKKMAEVNKEVADQVARDVADNAEEVLKKVRGKSGQAKDVAGKAKKEAKKLTPQELLAGKISKAINPHEKKANLEQEMINTLFRIASKDLPPKLKKNPLEPVVLALKDKNKYQEVWQRAKEILRKKYAKDPEKLEILEDYLEKKLRPVFEQGKLNSAINSTLKEMNVNLSKIVKEHYTVGNKARDSLVNRLVKEAGLSGEEAATLENYIRSRMKDLTKAKKEAILKQMFKPRTPAEKTMVDRLIEYSNLGALQSSKYRDLIAQKIGLPHLDEETAMFISKQMQKLQTMPEGREKDIELAKVMQSISNKIPATLSRKIATFQTIAMLANPKTMIRNLGGNVLFAGAENVSQTLGAGIDKGISLITGKRTTLTPDMLAQFKSGVRGAKEAVEDYRLGVDTSPARTQYDLPNNQAFGGTLGKVERLTGFGLKMGDRPFWKAAYDESLRQQMKIAKVKEPTPEMIQKAQELANYRTYQDVNGVTKLFTGLKKAFNRVGTEDFGLGDLVLKFPKTPANILARAIDYSPVQVVNMVRSFTRNGFDQKKFVDAASRGLTGTGAIVLGYFLAKNGVITGQANKDKDVAALEKSSGIGIYAFNTDALKRLATGKETTLQEGDTFRTYDWAQPISFALAIGADIFMGGQGEREATTVAIDALKSGGTTLLNQSLLQGVQRFMGGYNFMDNLVETAANAPAGFAPTLLKQVSQLIDPGQKEIYDPDELSKGMNLVKAKIPLVSGGLQPKIDTFGNDVQLYQGDNSVYNVMLNPGFTTEYRPTPEGKMAFDVWKATGDKDVLPKALSKYITVDGKRYDLTPQEYTDIQRIAGTLTKEGFAQISPQLSKEEQAKQMKRVIDKAGKAGRNYIREKRGYPLLKR